MSQNAEVSLQKLFQSYIENNSNNINRSIVAFLIDVNGLCNIIDFCNTHKSLHWRAHVMFIRYMCLILYEGVTYLGLSDQARLITDEFDNIKKLRMKIHQFRFKVFSKNLTDVEAKMGRSRDILKPMLDMFIEYKKSNTQLEFLGTNIWSYFINTTDMQTTVDTMQKLLRYIQSEYPVSESIYTIPYNSADVTYKNYPYCYTEFYKTKKFKSDSLVDRLILSLDELAGIEVLFRDTFNIEEIKGSDSFMILFFAKFISIVFNETMDNLNNFAKNSEKESNDYKLVSRVLIECNKELVAKALVVRNNLHYEEQDHIELGSCSEIYNYILELLNEIDRLKKMISELIFIEPTQLKLMTYRFLRWVQLPSDRNSSVDSII